LTILNVLFMVVTGDWTFSIDRATSLRATSFTYLLDSHGGLHLSFSARVRGHAPMATEMCSKHQAFFFNSDCFVCGTIIVIDQDDVRLKLLFLIDRSASSLQRRAMAATAYTQERTTRH
jgi:hypothetical protein